MTGEKKVRTALFSSRLEKRGSRFSSPVIRIFLAFMSDFWYRICLNKLIYYINLLNLNHI